MEKERKDEEEEIEYIRGAAARKVKRLSADDKTASRKPRCFSKGAHAVSLARSSRTNLRRDLAIFRRFTPSRNFETCRKMRARSTHS